MADVTIRELRYKGGVVIERVVAGEVLTCNPRDFAGIDGLHVEAVAVPDPDE